MSFLRLEPLLTKTSRAQRTNLGHLKRSPSGTAVTFTARLGISVVKADGPAHAAIKDLRHGTMTKSASLR